MKRNEDSLRDLWVNIKCTNIHIIGVSEGKEKGPGKPLIFEEVIAISCQNEHGNAHSSSESAQSSLQGKSTEECAQTHINHIDKN